MGSPRSRAARWLAEHGLLALAAAGALVVTAQVLRNDLVWDDTYLISTMDISGGLGRLGAVVSAPFWDNSSYLAGQLRDYWRPLTSAVIWISAVALDKAPAGLHLLSLLAAIAAAACVARLVARAAGGGAEARRLAPWVGLLFLAHPLGAEVLCLVANLSDHLALIFLALQVTALFDYVREDAKGGGGGARRLWLAAALGFAACASKEIGVVGAAAPLAAFLLARAATPEIGARSIARIGPWAAALVPVAAYLLLRGVVIAGAGGSASPVAASHLSWGVAAIGFGQAVARAILPVPQGAYAHVAAGSAAGLAAAAAAWILLAALIAFDALRRRRLSLASIGVLVALALVVPSLAAADAAGGWYRFPVRVFHLPLAGLLIALVPALRRRWSVRIEIVLALAVGLLLLLSWARIGEWRSEVSFYGAELRYHPASDSDRVNLAQALCQVGAFDDAQGVLQPLAAPETRFSSPLVQATYLNARARISLERDGDPEAAARALEAALAIAPDDLVNVLALAEARFRAGRPDAALAILEGALESPRFRDRREVIERQIEILERRAAAESDRGSR
jgi:tetratricopeptide (TPR) repeat protein